MTVKVRRIDGNDVQPSGTSFKRLNSVRANLRKGYQTEFAPYPSEEGKWLIRLVRPKRGSPSNYTVDSYYEIIAKNQDEARDFILKDKLWGGSLTERIAHNIGHRGEVHAVTKIKTATVVDSVSGKSLNFTDVKQYQNASGHGVDILAKISKVDPDPPPNVGDFVSFEVKSTLGAADNPPGIRRAQKRPGKKNGFVESRLTRAKDGDGYPDLLPSDDKFLRAALRAVKTGKMQYRKVDIRMDHSGALASTGGKLPMEILEWK